MIFKFIKIWNKEKFNKLDFIILQTHLTEYGNKCVKNNIIPAKPIEAGNKFCNYCSFYERCGIDGEGEVQLWVI